MPDYPPKSARVLFGEFLAHLEPRRRKQLVLLMGFMLIGSIAEVITIGAVVPFISLMARPEMAAEFPLLQIVLGSLGWQDAESIAIPMAVIFLAIVAFATVVRLLLIYAGNRLIFAIGYDIGVKLYQVILHQPYAYHITRNTSDVIADFNKVQILLVSFLRPAMDGVIAAVLSAAILVALMLVDAATALIAGILFTALYFGVIQLFRSRLRKNSIIIAATQGSRIRTVQEGLGGIRDVILDTNQAHYTREFSKQDHPFRTAQAANAFLAQAPRYVVEAIGVLLIVILAVGLAGQPGGLMDALPVLGALALGAARLLPLIQKIYAAWAQYTGNFNVFVDVLDSLNLPAAAALADSKPLEFKRQITLKEVSFRYSKNEPEVLSDISLSIPRGARIGIVGKTGSGKSTLMDLLMGLLRPTAGQIFIDDQPLGADNLGTWRRHISHVPQHIYLSDASIGENIALGISADAIALERIRDAARQAQIADFIETHRQGYDTRVGERGIQLSGGQRQRIGIARALYKDADVLVFDEASSALDMHTETAVMNAVTQLDPDLTVLIIAHRVQTLRDCDLVIRLEEGRLVAQGRYRDVIGGDSQLQPAALKK